MATFRERALAVASSRDVKRHCVEDGPISTYFGQNVFALETMRRYMSNAAFLSILQARKTGNKIDRSMAEEIASGMKTWAIEQGATHYTHLFQPLTGSTAEKHEAFLSFQRNRMLPASPTEGFATPLRPAATQPGTPILPPLSWTKPCASLPFLYLIPERPWT